MPLFLGMTNPIGRLGGSGGAMSWLTASMNCPLSGNVRTKASPDSGTTTYGYDSAEPVSIFVFEA